jgi:hypothetical protein
VGEGRKQSLFREPGESGPKGREKERRREIADEFSYSFKAETL